MKPKMVGLITGDVTDSILRLKLVHFSIKEEWMHKLLLGIGIDI